MQLNTLRPRLDANVIDGFVQSVLGSRFDGRSESAPFHRECWELCTGPDRFIAIGGISNLNAIGSGIKTGEVFSVGCK